MTWYRTTPKKSSLKYNLTSHKHGNLIHTDTVGTISWNNRTKRKLQYNLLGATSMEMSCGSITCRSKAIYSHKL
jgi:hypothetical protein